jgi:cell wall-associated NlpC family hydrolase
MLLIALTPVAVAAPESDPDGLEDPKHRGLLGLAAHSKHGGHITRTGFDCGGLVAYVFGRAWGLTLPSRPEQQAKLGKRVSRHALEPGDLLFYNTRNRAFSHVAIYIGDGRFIHAPRRGQPIRAASLDHPYWAARFSGARRLAPPA